MLSHNKILPSIFLAIILSLAAAEEETPLKMVPATTDHFESHVPLAWSGQYSRLPLQERGSAIPLIPEGHRKFQFFLYGSSGQLIPTWLSLQQIQNILLAVDPKEELNKLTALTSENDGATTITPRPKDTVQDVIASVQQVISSEVAQNQDPQIVPTTLADPYGQSLSIPEVILQNLMVLQQHTTPWQSSGTIQPITASEFSPTLGLLEPVNTETTTPESVTDTLFANGGSETTIGTSSTLLDPADKIPPALKPLIDRWNSRFPSWDPSNPDNEIFADSDKNSTIETTDDYHALPPSLSETIIPMDNEIHDEGMGTTLGGNLKLTSHMEGVKDTTETSLDPGVGITMSYSDSTSQPPNASSSDAELHPTTSEIIDEFYHTTLSVMQDDTVVNKNDAEKVNSLIFSMNNEESILNSTQGPILEETTPMSQLQSAVINMATNLIEPSFQTTISNNQQIKDTAESIISQLNKDITDQEAASVPGESAGSQAAPYNEDNLSPLLIRDPLLPQTVYDIQPISNPPTTVAPPTEKPESPYDTPTTFLTVIDPSEYTTHSMNADVDVSSERPSSLLDVLQDQGDISSNYDDDMKPHYEFPVKEEDMQANFHLEVIPSTHTEETNIHTTIQAIIDEMMNKLEVTTQYSTESNVGLPGDLGIEAGDHHIDNYLTSSESLGAATTRSYNSEKDKQTPGYSEEPLEQSTETPTIFVPVTQGTTIEAQTTFVHTSASSPTPQTTLENHNTYYPLQQGPAVTEVAPQTPTRETPAEPTLQAQELPRPSPFPEYNYYYYDEVDRYENVLRPAQLVHKDQSRIDLAALQGDGNHTNGDYFYDYLDQPVYLDDVPKEYYDYNVDKEEQPPLNVTGDLEFPGPNATSPYHDHHHDEHHHHGEHHHGEHQHGDHHHGDHHHHDHHKDPSSTGDAAQLLEAPVGNPGLEATVENLDRDVRRFVDVMNDITFKVYKQAARQYKRKNFVMSPLSLISTLNILLLGARGSTSAALSDLLLIDEFYTFNPHLILKNVTEAILEMSDVHDVAFFKQFLVEKAANPYPMDFFSRTIDYFYGANITEMEPKAFDKEIREIMNAVVSKATRGSVLDFMSEEPLGLTPPLSVVSTNFFHGRWSSSVTETDLFDMNFIRFPTAERRLIRTVGLKKKMTVNAGYSKEVGVTCAEIPYYSPSGELSLVLVMPGEQKNFVANGLAQVESVISSSKWSQILRSMLPNTVLFKMPVFRHRSFHNFSGILNSFGLEELFKDTEADFSGINTVKTLHLRDVVQLTEFQSCQVEESRPANSVASRTKRSSGNGLWGGGLGEGQDISPTSYEVPTYIYGLPMTEYLRKNLGRKSDHENASWREKLHQNSPSVSKTMNEEPPTVTPFGGLNERSSLAVSIPAGVKRSSFRKVDSEEHITNVEVGSPPLTSGDAPDKNEKAFPSADSIDGTQHHGGFDEARPLGSDVRYNRMGLPYDEPMEGNSDRYRESPSSYGAYYRQNNDGVLAFDRAFMYAVRHNPTGLLLFVGRYLDPEGN
ncbi:uncharacterized protein [Macrobrachium rosenbergii]